MRQYRSEVAFLSSIFLADTYQATNKQTNKCNNYMNMTERPHVLRELLFFSLFLFIPVSVIEDIVGIQTKGCHIVVDYPAMQWRLDFKKL